MFAPSAISQVSSAVPEDSVPSDDKNDQYSIKVGSENGAITSLAFESPGETGQPNVTELGSGEDVKNTASLLKALKLKLGSLAKSKNDKPKSIQIFALDNLKYSELIKLIDTCVLEGYEIGLSSLTKHIEKKNKK